MLKIMLHICRMAKEIIMIIIIVQVGEIKIIGKYFFSFLYDLKRLRSTINRGAPLLSFVGRRKKNTHTHTHTNVSHERHLNLMEK